MRFQALVLAALAVSPAALAQTQIPIPNFSRTFSASSLTRGFWFQAPVSMIVTGMRVPDETMHGMQAVELIDLGGSPPPAYPGTVNGTQLFYAANQPSANIIPVNVLINAGDYIGVLGACGDATIMHNSYGPNGPFNTTIFGNPITLTRFGTQTNIVQTGGNGPVWQEPAFNVSRVEVYVAPPSGFALSTAYGSGCGADAPASFYELFDGTNPNDLPNSGITLNWTGQTYVITQGAQPIVTPTGAPTPFMDDDTQQIALPWSYPTQLGSTNSVWVCSNGFIALEPTTITDFTESVGELLGGPMRFCLYWDDFNPGSSGGGAINLEQDPNSSSLFHITWTGVPEYSNTGANDFQLTLHQSGTAEFKWGAMTATDGLVGYSPGNGAPDPGGTDISMITAFPLGTGRPDLVLVPMARPVLGMTATNQTENIPTGSTAGFIVYGLQQINPGMPVPAPVVATGCLQYVSLDVATLFVPAGSTQLHSLPIPMGMSFVGATVNVQSTVLDPLSSQFITTNGVSMTADVQ